MINVINEARMNEICNMVADGIAITPDEFNSALLYVSELAKKAGTTVEQASKATEKVDEKKASLLARSWGKTVDAARWTWALVVRIARWVWDVISFPVRKLFNKNATCKAVVKVQDNVVPMPVAARA